MCARLVACLGVCNRALACVNSCVCPSAGDWAEAAKVPRQGGALIESEGAVQLCTASVVVETGWIVQSWRGNPFSRPATLAAGTVPVQSASLAGIRPASLTLLHVCVALILGQQTNNNKKCHKTNYKIKFSHTIFNLPRPGLACKHPHTHTPRKTAISGVSLGDPDLPTSPKPFL